MNRMEEYNNLMLELNMPVPELEGALERANKKYRRRNRVIRTIVSSVSVFVLFVLLVNVSAPVAHACSRIPVLKELAKAVTFSPSLTDAVENEYAQPIGLVQRDGDVEATIAYLIVDQKQVNVFFSLDSEIYTEMNAHPRILDADGSSPTPCSYSLNAWDVPNGELNSITIDFVDQNVPDSLLLKLDIMDYGQPAEESVSTSGEDLAASEEGVTALEEDVTAAEEVTASEEDVTAAEGVTASEEDVLATKEEPVSQMDDYLFEEHEGRMKRII